MNTICLQIFVGNSSGLCPKPVNLEVASGCTIHQLKVQFSETYNVPPDRQVWIFRNVIALNEDTLETLKVSSIYFGVVYVDHEKRLPIRTRPIEPEDFPTAFCNALSAKYNGAELNRRIVTNTHQPKVLLDQSSLDSTYSFNTKIEFVGLQSEEEVLPQTHGWKCPNCKHINEAIDTLCPICAYKRRVDYEMPSMKHKPSASEHIVEQKVKERRNSMQAADWPPGEHFRRDPNLWSCVFCNNVNTLDNTKCIRCDRPNTTARPKVLGAVKRSEVDEKRVQAYGWKCPICYIVNEATILHCCHCQGERPVHYEMPSDEFLTADDIRRLQELNIAKMTQRKLQAENECELYKLALEDVDTQPWSCEACTLMNPGDSLNCMVCERVKPRSQMKEKVAPPEDNTTPASEEKWLCELCAAKNTAEAKFCSNCGNKRDRKKLPMLEDQDQKLQTAAAPRLKRKHRERGWTCPLCTYKNTPAYLNCFACGH